MSSVTARGSDDVSGQDVVLCFNPGSVGYNPAWYALAHTGIAWDPGGTAGGNDNNTGAPGSPVLTMGEIIRRFGSNTPQLGYAKNCIINQGTLAAPSPQPLLQDEVFFEPYVSGGGKAILNVALASAGADFALGALSGGYGFAGAAPSAGGVEMTIAAVPGYVVANTLLENTVTGDYAIVDAVNGGNATVSQPQTKASLLQTNSNAAPVVGNAWVAGQNIKAWTRQSVNLGRWSAIGGDRTAAGVTGGAFVQLASIAAANVGSSYAHANRGTDQAMLQCCHLVGSLQMSGTAGRSNAVSIRGCSVTGTLNFMPGPGDSIYGGFVRGNTTCFDAVILVTNNAVLHGVVAISGLPANLGNMFMDGSLLVFGIAQAEGFVWGSFACTVEPGCAYQNAGGGTFTNTALLTNGALLLGTSATGSAYVGAGVMTDGIALTPAAIDAGGAGGAGLFNPKTGARFCNAA